LNRIIDRKKEATPKLVVAISALWVLISGVEPTFHASNMSVREWQHKEVSSFTETPPNVPTEVFNNQPRLHIDPEEVKRNGRLPQIRYCINRMEGMTYYTYVYVWTFSDTPWWAQVLGYPDHAWDYEPVIVCIDNETGQTKYIYDKGHYRAGVTQNRELDVKRGSHYFGPSSKTGGVTFSRENFKEMTDEQLQLMNKALGEIPRIPFGRELSLNWACKNPEKVEQKGSFSTDR